MFVFICTLWNMLYTCWGMVICSFDPGIATCRERERERERGRERERQRETERERQRETERDRDRERQRERDPFRSLRTMHHYLHFQKRVAATCVYLLIIVIRHYPVSVHTPVVIQCTV